MRYALVTTASHLLCVDLSNGHVIPVEAHRGEYYGITWLPHSDKIILSHSGLSNSSLVDIKSYAQSEVGWISFGHTKSGEFLSQPHQILAAPDGNIICTNTGRNAITIVNLEKPNIFLEARLSQARWDRLDLLNTIGDHLNSVFLKDSALYVLAHRHDKGSQLGVFSYPELELVNIESVGTRTGLHNIWITDEGQKISCHSEAGSLIDLDDDRPLWESGSSIYTRGLAASQDCIVIGESLRGDRADRLTSWSGLWILDRKNFQTVDYVSLGPYGAVNEVRLIDTPDEAHHGFVFSGLELILEEDMRKKARASRIAQSKFVYDNRPRFYDFEVIFGSPEFLPNGGLKALKDNLCLITKNLHSVEAGIGCHYNFGPDEVGAHVSAVIGYSGGGGDAHMAAILIQPSGVHAELTVWLEEGSGWKMLDQIRIGGLSKEGDLAILPATERVLVQINSENLLELESTKLGLDDCSIGLGLRWIGTTIMVKRNKNAK